jgi:hypothetical protein
MQIDALTRAMDAVHTAVLAGRIDDLAPLTDMITTASADLTTATEQQMRLIQGMAARNALCLQSAMKGIRAAQRRVAELRAASTGHATYDQNGQRARLGAVAGNLRQRI